MGFVYVFFLIQKVFIEYQCNIECFIYQDVEMLQIDIGKLFCQFVVLVVVCVFQYFQGGFQVVKIVCQFGYIVVQGFVFVVIYYVVFGSYLLFVVGVFMVWCMVVSCLVLVWWYCVSILMLIQWCLVWYVVMQVELFLVNGLRIIVFGVLNDLISGCSVFIGFCVGCRVLLVYGKGSIFGSGLRGGMGWFLVRI